MKIKFLTDDVLGRLQQAVAVVNSKNALPILGDILFETREDGNGGRCLMMTASDSEVWLSIKAPVIECDADVRFCIAAEFSKTLANLKGKEIEMDLDGGTATCKYANGHFSMPYDNADEFPKPATIDKDSADTYSKVLIGSHLLVALEKTGFATASDELRPVMNGVHFDFMQNGMVAAASDGHKLAKYTDKTITSDNEQPTGFTLPKKPTTILTNILNGYDGNVKVVYNDRNVIVNNTDFMLTARLIEGRYPNYESAIPKNNNVHVILSKADMLSALKRVVPMSNSSSELIMLSFAVGELTISAQDYDFSKSASERVTCDFNDKDLVMGFKGSTMIEVLRNIDADNIRICLSDPSRAGLFEPANDSESSEYVSLLMPMLIQSE